MCCRRPSSASFLALESLHVGIESIEALAPELLESTDPLVDRLEPPGVEPVEALLPRLAHGHEPDLAQYAQMLGDARLRDAERPRQFVHRSLPPLEQCEDAPALRLGDRVERVCCGRGSCHERKICPYRNITRGRPRGPVRRDEASRRSAARGVLTRVSAFETMVSANERHTAAVTARIRLRR